MSTPETTPTATIDIPKNYDHSEVEGRWTRAWTEACTYAHDPRSAAARAGRIFSVDTPPPYVSAAHLHVGHAMSYSQAEFVVRFWRMRGHEVFYPMGFDDNGLPTERYVEQVHKVNKAKIERQKFVELCLDETRKGGQVYRDLWTKLGLSVDWSLLYSTIQPRAVKNAQRSFLELVREGFIERRNDPIQWCPACSTSLAQADVESSDEVSRPLYTIRFHAADATIEARLLRDNKGLIETTRPELVPANVALAAHPEDPVYGPLAKAGTRFRVPLTDRTVPLILDDAVDRAFGTGLMMVCTFGDPEDVQKWRVHKLDTQMIVGPDGRIRLPSVPAMDGKRVHVLEKGSAHPEARLAAIEALREAGHLVVREGPDATGDGGRKSTTRVSIHERCGTPVEILVAPQWFIRLLDYKEELLQRGRELRWYPAFMRERYEDWVTNLKWDWNISRQRYYGVPFPVWYCDACGEPHFAPPETTPIDPQVSACPHPACSKCGHATLRPERDVMDTWMTSSITPLVNANWANWTSGPHTWPGASIDAPSGEAGRPEIYPMTVRVQAFEIIRTWLFYTVAKSHLHTGSLPWRDVMISGWGLDQHGKKMSKRAGNFVDPDGIISKYSADALRYWSAGSTLGHDLRFNERDVANGKRLLTKLWNSTRFALQNLGAWRPEEAVCEAPTAADQWVRSRLVATIDEATKAFERYEYSHALRAVEQFFWSTWCDNYLEIVKERFWTPESFDPAVVEAGRRTIWFGTGALLRLFAPFLPFITEELYQRCFRNGSRDFQSIHRASWPSDGARADVFGGARDPEAERLGDLLVDLLGGVRQLRTASKLGSARKLATVNLAPTDGQSIDFTPIIADLRTASRAISIEIGGEATLDIPNRAIKVGIVPVPEETPPPQA